ncbi:MAG: tetraacyldisaccharide 4'-kinase [Rhizobiales bacterium]|nr:tetraacyldisaccharide 4'-kinase [Hyphomicrobiales bacterium]
MREPAFWYRPPSLASHLLSPLGAIYGAVAAWRMNREGIDAGIPVICVGNFHTGGAGKTPATLKISEMLRTDGETPFVVSRGYGGRLTGPVRVDPQIHTARDVGDEPLMMSSRVPVIVSRDRAAGAALAKSQGAGVILLDDGFQNPSLRKNMSLIVVDANRGIGNGFVFPAGSLRAPLKPQIDKTDALIVVGSGHGTADLERSIENRNIPVLQARLKADQRAVSELGAKSVLAFAGIGDPSKFFSTLRENNISVAEERVFADHHAFSIGEIEKLMRDAAKRSLTLLTTEKDIARIRSDPRLIRFADRIATLPVTLEFDDEAALSRLVTARLAAARK